MESTLHNPALIAARTTSRATTIAWWIVTASSVWRCASPHITSSCVFPRPPRHSPASASPLRGSASSLSWAKVAGIIVRLVPMIPARLKACAYAGFAISLVSALIAHLSLGQGPRFWSPSAITSVLWVLSYIFWRRLQTAQANASSR